MPSFHHCNIYSMSEYAARPGLFALLPQGGRGSFIGEISRGVTQLVGQKFITRTTLYKRVGGGYNKVVTSLTELVRICIRGCL